MPKSRDLYEELTRNFEFLLGRMANREAFKDALRGRISQQDMEIIFLLPFGRAIPIAEAEQRAVKAGIPVERLHDAIRRLVPEGFIISYVKTPEVQGGYDYPGAPLADLQHEGRVVQRGDLLVMGEQQVRKPVDDPLRRETAKWFNVLIEDAGRSISMKTPSFRVIPAEGAVREEPAYGRKIVINAEIPDPRETLPLDIVSEMVRKEPVIAVADCYCRRTKRIIGDPCDHPEETCMYFNELALVQIETGRARRIDHDEALAILEMCEQAGLVHNISNCEGHITTLCNCCTCSCGVMKSLLLGGSNATSPSRFVVAHAMDACTHCGVCVGACPMRAMALRDGQLVIDFDRCIGCGLCVVKCPHGSLSMTLRENPPPVYRDSAALNRRHTREAILGLARRRIREGFQALMGSGKSS